MRTKRQSPILRPGDWAWVALATGVVVYEVMAPEEELLSEAVDRYLMRRKILTTGTVLYVAAHLVNWLPNSVDIFHRLAVLSGRAKGENITL